MNIHVRGLSFRYPGALEAALEEVDLSWDGSGFRVVTGPLGSGCSTLLLALAGIAPRVTSGVRSGVVEVHGWDPATHDGARHLAGRVGLLLPTPWTQLSGMTYRVRDEIAFGPANLGWPRPRIDDAVERVVNLLGIPHLVDRVPTTLSGGELLQVILGGLLAIEPEVLLLDEPGAELDPVTAVRIYRLLRSLAGHVSVVLATTDLDRVAFLADSILVLAGGKRVTEGEPGVALRSPAAVERGVTTTIGHVMRVVGGDSLPLDVEDAIRVLGGS